MSVQIALRLPDDVVEFIDAEVADGNAESRTAVVHRALNRERRRRTTERDAETLANQGRHSLDDLAEYAVNFGLRIGLD